MNIDTKALKGFVEEIEASRARQRAETELQREIYKKVEQAQFETKAVRIVIQRRSMGEESRDEQDFFVHAYELALGGKKDAIDALEKGASIREAAKLGGVSVGTAAKLARGVQKSTSLNTEAKPEIISPPESQGLPLKDDLTPPAHLDQRKAGTAP